MRLFSRDGLSLTEIIAKNVIYEIIDPILWIHLLNENATLIHASAVAVGDSAVVFSGAGGVGKSSSLLALMQEVQEALYVSDDMAIVEPGGWVSRHAKHMQIYEYNLRTASGIREALDSGTTSTQRLLWDMRVHMLGPHRVRRRMPARDLFGSDRVCDRARISRAVWVVPSDTSQPSWRYTSSAHFAELATTAILSEFWDFLRLLNATSLTGGGGESVTALAEKSRASLESSLAGVECRILSVPTKLPSDVLADFLKDGL